MKSKMSKAKSKIKKIRKMSLSKTELRKLSDCLMNEARIELTFNDLFEIIRTVVKTTIQEINNKQGDK